MSEADHEFPVTQLSLLADAPQKPVGLSLPLPIDEKLTALVEAARQGGERTSRKELVAALVLGASYDAEALSALLRQYRLAPLDGPEDASRSSDVDGDVEAVSPAGRRARGGRRTGRRA